MENNSTFFSDNFGGIGGADVTAKACTFVLEAAVLREFYYRLPAVAAIVDNLIPVLDIGIFFTENAIATVCRNVKKNVTNLYISVSSAVDSVYAS
jgi:hypothetical protein